MRIKINLPNAIIQRPNIPARPKAIQTNTEWNCFFDAISFMENNPKNSALNIVVADPILSEVQEQVIKYSACHTILKEIVVHISTIEATIRTERSTQWLKNNLLANLQGNKSHFLEKFGFEVTPQFCDDYINLFYDIVEAAYGSNFTTTLSNWLKLPSKLQNGFVTIALGKAALNFLQQIGYTESTILNTVFELDVIKKHAVYFNFMQRKIAENYNYSPDYSWNPRQSIDSFMSILQTKEHLIIRGKLGANAYDKPPTKSTIGKLEVYGWNKADFKKTAILTHEVIVIGASKAGYAGTTEDLVYIMNPYQHKNKQKIFVISYKDFCTRVFTIEGKAQDTAGIIDAYFYSKTPFHPQPKLAANNQSFFFSCKKSTALIGLAAATTAAVATYLTFSS